MNALISIDGGRLLISDPQSRIQGRQLGQLAYWGFAHDTSTGSLVATPTDIHSTLDKVLEYAATQGLAIDVDAAVELSRTELHATRAQLRSAMTLGARFKEGQVATDDVGEFVAFAATKLKRTLKDHQLKAALHWLAVENGANFSVPGSGKTAVVLAVFAWLKSRGVVDSLFVVGPPACFRPWRDEYAAVLGFEPNVALLAGGDAEARQHVYHLGGEARSELYLTSFQTLQRDWEQVRHLFGETGTRFFLVFDEAHNVKQVGGAWATAALHVAALATRRCVLTGTPFPRAYSDAFNLFDILWPRNSPISSDDRTRVEWCSQKGRDDEAAQILRNTIGPLFYRVRKGDLNLAPQHFHDPVFVEMMPGERRLYDAIVDRVKAVSAEDYLRNIDLLLRLRRGRMMRLRQAVSYAKLLGTAVLDAEYNESLVCDDTPLADLIRQYDDVEVPGKLTALVRLVRELTTKQQKVVIWSTFVGSLQLIRNKLLSDGHDARLIFGMTPSESATESDEETREQIIAAFADPTSGVDVLVANPAACAESISLHKTCSNAIYYDLSYNCGQYLQSLDRIHRVGGSERKIAHYHFLQYANTVDQDILANLKKKADRMSAIVDEDFPVYGLDMFSDDDELEAYDRLFR